MKRNISFAFNPLWVSLAAGILLFSSSVVYADSETTQSSTSPGSAGSSDATPASSSQSVSAQPAASASASTSSSDAESAANSKVKDIVGTFESQGVLTPRGHFVIDPSIQYATSSSDRVSLVGFTVIPAITIGLININRVTRNSFVAAVDGRYGITNDLEFDAHIPYVYQNETTQENPLATPSSGPQNFTANGGGVGDVLFGWRYQFNHPDMGQPFYVGSLKVNAPTGKGPFDVPYSNQTGLETKPPTGSGFWGLQAGLTWIMPTDPAVFYAGLSYQYNFKRNINKTLFIQSESGAASSEFIGEVKPGDVFEFNFGMGFGINDKASFSIGYDHSVVGRTQINGSVPEGSQTVQVGQLLIGFSYRVSQKQTVNLTLGVGVTPNAPNAQITLHTPFDL